MFYEPVWEYEGHKLVQRPDTSNYAIYWKGPRDRRIRRQSTRTSDLDEAKRKLVEFVRARAKPKPGSAENVLILDTLCDYVDGADASPDQATGRSRERAVYALRHLSEFFDFEGIDTVADFTIGIQHRYIEQRFQSIRARGSKGSNGTINRELAVLKAALNSAWKHGRLDQVPHIGLLPPPPARDRFLRQPEVLRLLNACASEHLRLYVRLALHTLQRPIAIYSLRVEQIDLEWGRIDFLPKGVRQSNKRRPVVPITPTLRPHLEEAIRNSVTGHILEYNGRPISSVKKSFRRAVDNAGLKDVTPYTLRHTGATLMAAAGVPLRQIAGMLGHTESRTTEIYAKHHPDFLRDASAAIEALFGERELPAAERLLALPAPK